VSSRFVHKSAPSPLVGRYLAHNPALVGFLAIADEVLRFRRPSPSAPMPDRPRRVLLAVGGHLGDAVVATAAIAYLRAVQPDTEIGLALPSWARAVFDGDDRVRWIHEIDHWKPNRSGGSFTTRWRRYRRTRRQAIKEIQLVGYDAAVDLYAYYPNMATLLWRAGVPVRVGLTSGGFGGLYTHRVDWLDDRRHLAEHQRDLVRLLAPEHPDEPPLRYTLPTDTTAAKRVKTLLASTGADAGDCVLVHIGSGSDRRKWSTESWVALAKALEARGRRLVFTGRGEQEAAAVRSIAARLSRPIDLCDRLDWREFVEAIRGARLVITVETAAAHVAAAVGTPCVAIWSGITSRDQWRPLGDAVVLISREVPCAPCFRSRGCAAMSCVRDLTVIDVLAGVERQLEGNGTPVAVITAERLINTVPG
jgi:ADP-heptose:LPS heptosyltransferase